jgi:hypothetical protein
MDANVVRLDGPMCDLGHIPSSQSLYFAVWESVTPGDWLGKRGIEMSDIMAEQAVVIGAGMGGLAAAKATAPCFERVIVLERDALPEASERRRRGMCTRCLPRAKRRWRNCFLASGAISGRPTRSSSEAATSSGKGPATIRSRGEILD